MSTETERGICRHTESLAHCPVAACWNYQDDCPRHFNDGYRPSAPCVLEGEQR